MRFLTVCVTALLLAALGCDGDRTAETVPEGSERAAPADERPSTVEELKRDADALHERLRELPPEERERFREEMHREMRRDSTHPMHQRRSDEAGERPGRGHHRHHRQDEPDTQ